MVEEFEIAPNWLGSIIFNIASAAFEIVDVRDIGRRCLLRFVIGFS